MIWIPYSSRRWNLQLCRSHTPFWLPMGCLSMTSRCSGLSSLELEVDKHDWTDSLNKAGYTQDALHKHHIPFEDLKSWISGASSFYPLNSHHKIFHHKIGSDAECKLLDENVLHKACKKGQHYQATTLMVQSTTISEPTLISSSVWGLSFKASSRKKIWNHRHAMLPKIKWCNR